MLRGNATTWRRPRDESGEVKAWQRTASKFCDPLLSPAVPRSTQFAGRSPWRQIDKVSPRWAQEQKSVRARARPREDFSTIDSCANCRPATSSLSLSVMLLRKLKSRRPSQISVNHYANISVFSGRNEINRDPDTRACSTSFQSEASILNKRPLLQLPTAT